MWFCRCTRCSCGSLCVDFCSGYRILLFFFFFFLMIRRPPISTRTDTLFPYTTLFRSRAIRATATERFQARLLRSGYGIAPLRTKLNCFGCVTTQKMVRRKLGECVRLTTPYATASRSEERCVGKESDSECRSRWSPYHYIKDYFQEYNFQHDIEINR